MLEPEAIRLWALFVLVTVAAGFDLWQRRVPNWLTSAGVVAGVTLNSAHSGWGGFRESAYGLILASAVYLVFFALRAMGGGDLKLMAAVGSIVGPTHWLTVFVFASLIGAGIAVAVSLTKGRLGRMLAGTVDVLRELLSLRRPALDVRHADAATLPHAVAIALGAYGYLLIAGHHR